MIQEQKAKEQKEENSDFLSSLGPPKLKVVKVGSLLGLLFLSVVELNKELGTQEIKSMLKSEQSHIHKHMLAPWLLT